MVSDVAQHLAGNLTFVGQPIEQALPLACFALETNRDVDPGHCDHSFGFALGKDSNDFSAPSRFVVMSAQRDIQHRTDTVANLDINFDEPKRTPPKAPAGITVFNRIRRYALMGFIVLGIVGFLVWLSDPLRDPTAGPRSNGVIDIGGQAALRYAGGDGKQPSFFHLATSPENMEQYRKTIGASDNTGLTELVLEGRVVEIPAGTRVKVLERDGSTCRVRVLEGKHVNEALWVDREFLDGIN